ncbi:MAG TPA: hypothetical protein VGD73_25750 [Pseudonocardia sp.]|jgi:hypothetical protein|uniref:hypothetical protein n=1 Tax=Pseudonocardia sp. TaxID=60912 RepID=UPI002EDB9EB4
MTETATPPVDAQPALEQLPQPVETRHTTRWVITSAVIVAVVAGGYVAWTQSTPTSPAAATRTCDPDMVTVHPTADSGVALFITAPGPNFVQVDVRDAFNHRRLFQQVPPRSSRAEFALWGDFMYRYRQIDVNLRTGGTCTVAESVLNELNRAHGWGR